MVVCDEELVARDGEDVVWRTDPVVGDGAYVGRCVGAEDVVEDFNT